MSFSLRPLRARSWVNQVAWLTAIPLTTPPISARLGRRRYDSAAKGDDQSGGEARLLSQRSGSTEALTPDAESRLNIDYRLDGRFDHWLLDEFQDTNHLQWQIIENLIDEVMQDASGERSYFQVGDVPGRNEPGTGEINWRNVFGAIRELGFEGIVGMEHGLSEPGREGLLKCFEEYARADAARSG